jgi:hypothetical protein
MRHVATSVCRHSCLQQVGNAVQGCEVSQTDRWVCEVQWHGPVPRCTLPSQQDRNGTRIDTTDLRQIDTLLSCCDRTQTGIKDAFCGVERQSLIRSKHRSNQAADLAASDLFLSVNALISPSMPPRRISAANVLLYVSTSHAPSTLTS